MSTIFKQNPHLLSNILHSCNLKVSPVKYSSPVITGTVEKGFLSLVIILDILVSVIVTGHSKLTIYYHYCLLNNTEFIPIVICYTIFITI